MPAKAFYYKMDKMGNPTRLHRRARPFTESSGEPRLREMALEYAGRTLSRYDVSLSREAKLEAVTNPRLFSNPCGTAQLRLFGLEDALGEDGWLKALRLEKYAAPTPSSRRCSLTWMHFRRA